MLDSQVLLHALHEAWLSLQQVAMSSPLLRHKSVALGVAVTAVAGVAVASAVGGTLLYTRRSTFSLRRRRKYHLTRKQWREAFDPVSGRLVNQYKVLKQIRFGGIEPSIRAEVWLFLLGFYELDSTSAERESEKARKREVYECLKAQSLLLRERMYDELSDGDGRIGSNGSESSSLRSTVDENTPARTSSADGATCEQDECREKLGDDELVSARQAGNSCIKDDFSKSRPMEDFITWQRIIRIDAVRMNAEWVPYSPSQANVTQDLACELAASVGLKDDEHLEPCRQHHAARLVAILEAYAIYDHETGYCQGMSDLLSPFVALLDEDYEAFWCFVEFMNSARYNFRMDEVGIRHQLSRVSNILKVGDHHLYNHLVSTHAEDCFFVYRMVVVLMRRELTFEQTICLWEVIWAEKRAVGVVHSKNSWKKARRLKKRATAMDDLLLYVIVSAVRQRRKTILERCKGMDDMLRECNSMAGHLDVWLLLDDARELVSAVHGRIPG